MSDTDLNQLLELLRLSPGEAGGNVQIVGNDPVVASPHRLGEASAIALAAQGAGIASIWKMRSGRGQNVTVNLADAVHGLHTLTYMKQHGHPISLHVVKEAITDFHRCGDGRWIFTTCSYPHLRDGVLDLLRCQNTKAAINNAVSKWSAQDLEDALGEQGLAAGMVRKRQEWLEHPQGRLLSGLRAIEITKIADGPPMPFLPAERPLSGIKVLDMTHVIAGPLLARTLAEQGADVLHVSQSNHDDPQAMVMEVGHGKRNAYIDFDNDEDMKQLNSLISSADVFVNSWRPGSIEHHGFGPDELARKRPGIIYVQESAYGLKGPW
ncbi:MAG: CoA transferase, partial [Candidatus Obscuribacterales bacterium]|nr:CoA transferase [Candidatus Obscuribacterales bacterium]